MKPAIAALFLAAGLTLFSPGEVQRVYPWGELRGCLQAQQHEEVRSGYRVRSVSLIVRKHDPNCHGAQVQVFTYSFQAPRESFTITGNAQNPDSIRAVRGK